MKNFNGICLCVLAIASLEARAKAGEVKNSMLNCLKQEMRPSREEFKALKEELKKLSPKIKELQREAATKKKEFKNLLVSTASDSEIKNFLESYKEIKSELMSLQFERVLAIRSRLNPEQRLKWGECQKKTKAAKGGGASEV